MQHTSHVNLELGIEPLEAFLWKHDANNVNSITINQPPPTTTAYALFEHVFQRYGHVLDESLQLIGAIVVPPDIPTGTYRLNHFEIPTDCTGNLIMVSVDGISSGVQHDGFSMRNRKGGKWFKALTHVQIQSEGSHKHLQMMRDMQSDQMIEQVIQSNRPLSRVLPIPPYSFRDIYCLQTSRSARTPVIELLYSHSTILSDQPLQHCIANHSTCIYGHQDDSYFDTQVLEEFMNNHFDPYGYTINSPHSDSTESLDADLDFDTTFLSSKQ